jgi:hypothetical protein
LQSPQHLLAGSCAGGQHGPGLLAMCSTKSPCRKWSDHSAPCISKGGLTVISGIAAFATISAQFLLLSVLCAVPAASPEGAVPVWRPRAAPDEPPSGARFVGMVSALDVAAFVAASGAGERALRAVVGEVVQPNPGLLREIDPGTR